MNAKYLTLAALLTATACSKPAEESREMPPSTVTTVVVNPEHVVLTRALTGRVNMVNVAEVRPQVTGIIRDVLFTEGSTVNAGQLLYQLDDASYQAAHNSNLAALNRANVALKLAEKNYKRAQTLIQANAISQQSLDDAEATYLSAKADVGVAQAAVDASAVSLGYTQITAPIDGVIGKSAFTKGALAVAGQQSELAVVRQLDPIYVDLTLSSREMTALQAKIRDGVVAGGQSLPVSITLEDGSLYPEKGELLFSEATVDSDTGSSLMRVQVSNPDHVLLPGMYVAATVSLATRENTILVPQQAVSRAPDGSTSVMILNNGTVELKPVTVEGSLNHSWIVAEGLSGGEHVITEGLQWIGPGAPAVEKPAATQQ